MSGGSDVNPYYQRDSLKLETKEKGTANKRDTGAVSSRKRKKIIVEKIRRLHFDQNLTQSQIAKKIGIPLAEVRGVFKQQRWKKHTRRYSDEDIQRMYYKEMLSISEIARRLGISYSTLYNIFQRNKWKKRPPPTKADPEEARKLYEKGLTHKEIAKELGVSRASVGNYLRGLEVRTRRRKSKYKSDEERAIAKKERSRNQLEKVKAKRDDLFGTKCRICGIERGEKRKIAVHRKDFTEHEDNALWRLGYLKSLNPDDWAANCVMCHRGVHWVHDALGMEWQDVEKWVDPRIIDGIEKERPLQQSTHETQPISANDTPLQDFDGDIYEIRKELFGEECYFCGPLPEDKTLTIHKKDGSHHRDALLWSKERLQELNPDEWQALCQRDHRYVHWAMKRLGMTWDDIESAYKKIRSKVHQ
ncbi:MAG: helix-turn-helix domain-containing protein [Candidatus Thorarchaeota archaeon]